MATTAAATTQNETLATSSGEVRLLVVEDDDLDYRVITRTLREGWRASYGVTRADTFEAALQRIEDGEFDAAIVDYRLDAKSGIDFIRAAGGRNCPFPIVLLTNQDARHVDGEALDAGAADFLSKKDLTPEALERSIRYALKSHQILKERDQERRRAEANAVLNRRFLSTIGHELRPPVDAIIGLLDLLDGQLASAEQREIAKDARNAAAHATEYLRNLVEFVRLDEGKAALSLREVDAEEFFRNVVAFFKVEADRRGLSLSLDIDNLAARRIRFDDMRVRQTLINLLANAMKFTEEGEVVVRARTSRSEAAERLHVSVSDTGCGIATEKTARLFDENASPPEPGRKFDGGLGLGLAISARNVDLMGGAIAAESVPGNGSTFRFEIPLAD
ncbi:ATP-binding protein [Hyphococcus sp.]|uniref:sensor histidine kinase n=1 Tax=Hyphococcus sp. TaxID=2038636 RepID=UPI003CCBA23F